MQKHISKAPQILSLPYARYSLSGEQRERQRNVDQTQRKRRGNGTDEKFSWS